MYKLGWKALVSIAIDIICAAVVCLAGLYIRLGIDVLSLPSESTVKIVGCFILAALIADLLISIYRDVWTYFSIDYINRYVKYSSLTILLFCLLLFISGSFDQLPRSVLFINWGFLVLFTALPRAILKIYREGTYKKIFIPSKFEPIPIIVIGLGKSSELFIQELRRQSQPTYKVIGILDTAENEGRLLLGVPILGTISNFKSVISKLKEDGKTPRRVIISFEANQAGLLPDLIQLCKQEALPISKLPRLLELSHNAQGNFTNIQPIAVEDLIKRPQKNLNTEQIEELVHNKSILVTGAGGSIGSEIVRQVLSYTPDKVTILDSSEFLLYEIEQEAIRLKKDIKVTTVLADISNSEEVEKALEDTKPDIIFHAAALKHVPLVEAHKVKAVKTNVLGTYYLLKFARDKAVTNFVFISTDKAADPLSFMGLTKRIAESICQAFASRNMRVSAVRFGNVIGSNGSVVPLFEKQIALGGPVTVTHPDVTRYFMTIPEAVGLVLQSACLGTDSVFTKFVLEMGSPIKIADLAKQMIVMAGFTPDKDIKIEYTGLRDGEKLHETLIGESEKLTSSNHPEIFICEEKNVAKGVNASVDAIVEKIHFNLDEEKIVLILKKLLKQL